MFWTLALRRYYCIMESCIKEGKIVSRRIVPYLEYSDPFVFLHTLLYLADRTWPGVLLRRQARLNVMPSAEYGVSGLPKVPY